MRGLFGYLDEVLPRPGGLLQVQALALVKEGNATLVPRALETFLELLSSPMHRLGFQFVDLETALVDLGTLESSSLPELQIPQSSRTALGTSTLRKGARNPITSFRTKIRSRLGLSLASGTVRLRQRVESTLLELLQSTKNAFDVGVPETLRALESFQSALRVGQRLRAQVSRRPRRRDHGPLGARTGEG